MSAQKSIKISDLVCMHDYANRYNFRVELAYARDDNLLFSEYIYKKTARLWLHKKLATVVFTAASNCFENHGLRFVLYDGLRTIEAQEKMMQTKRVLDNPHWLEPPRLLSTPGSGAHPRAMAIDIGLEEQNGALIDMGCSFDYLHDQPDALHNPAHRDHAVCEEVQKHRDILNNSILEAAKTEELEISLLPEEWWDFRLPKSYYEHFLPISDKNLPDHISLTQIT